MVREAADKGHRPRMSQHCAPSSTEQRRALGEAEAFISADMKFHTQIAAISGNPIYVAVSEAMLGWLKEYHTEMLIWTGKEKFTLAEHEEIIGRIEKQDADGAEKAMIKHLERSRALYVLNTDK